MKKEYTADDFAKAVKNPYIDKLVTRIEVPVPNEVYKIFKQVGDDNGVGPEVIMNRCLRLYAKRLAEDDD